MRVRASLQQGIRRRGPTHRRGLAEPGGQRHPARDLVARRVRVGGHRQRTGRRRARPGRHPVHAHPARHRHAPTDGRGPWVARHADRLRRHRRAGQRSRRLGVARPPGMGPVPTRQDQPELLHERAQLHHRRVLRGHRQVPRPDDRGSQSTRGDRVRRERRIGGRALRRHHDDVPQQLVRHRRPRHVAHLRVGGCGRGEERHRLQPRQPRRCAGRLARRLAYPACRSSRSIRAKARSSPTIRSSSSTPSGSRPSRRSRPRRSRSTCSDRRTRPRSSSSGSGRTTRACRSPIR